MTVPWIGQNISGPCWNRTSDKVSLRLYVLIVMVLFQIWHFRKLLQIFSGVSPLAGWDLPVQHSHNTVQLLSCHRNASDCCVLSKWVTSPPERRVQKMFRDETVHFHRMFGISRQCSGLAVKWVMKLTWRDSSSEASFYPRWRQRNLLRGCAWHLNTCLWNPLKSRHGEKLLYTLSSQG